MVLNSLNHSRPLEKRLGSLLEDLQAEDMEEMLVRILKQFAYYYDAKRGCA